MTNGVIGFSVGLLTFVILAALALPHLETSLTFIPIFGIAVLAGLVAPKVYVKIKKSN